MALTNCFSIITAFRNFHVFHNTANWNLRIGQEISCKGELNNEHAKFTVCVSAILPRKIGPAVGGDASKKLSRYIWFTSQKGAKKSAVVDNAKPYPSPLLLGGLEISVENED